MKAKPKKPKKGINLKVTTEQYKQVAISQADDAINQLTNDTVIRKTLIDMGVDPEEIVKLVRKNRETLENL